MQNNPISEQIAVNYLQAELAAARKSVRRTRIGCGVAMVFVACYMTFLVVTLHYKLLAPEAAADVITTYAINTVDQNVESFTDYVKKNDVIAALPDTIIDRVPIMRATIEEELENGLRDSCNRLTVELGEHLDTFMAEHEDELHAFFALSKDEQFIQQFGDGLETQLLALLEREVGNQKVKDSVQEGLNALTELEVRLNRLAYAKDLTPHEQRLRQVLALTIRLTAPDA